MWCRVPMAALVLSVLFASRVARAADDKYVEPAKKVATQLSAGQFEAVRAQFDENLKQTLPADKLKEGWDQTIAIAGAFKEILSADDTAAGAIHVVRVRCRCEDQPIIVKVVFGPDGKIGGLWVQPASAK